MTYEVELRPNADKDLDGMSPEIARRILAKIMGLRQNLAGDVKRLTHYVPEYRLRVGDWRVLFEVVGSQVTVHRVLHRSRAYD